MINLILVVLAKLLFTLISPFSFVYTIFIKEPFNWQRLFGYWRNSAVSWDRYGNYQYRSFWNATLITKKGYEFGDFRETISSVLGKNERDGTLSKLGIILTKILNKLDKDHCKNSINNFK